MTAHVVQKTSFIRLLVVLLLVPVFVLPTYFTLFAEEKSPNSHTNSDDRGYTTHNGTVLKFTSVENVGLNREYPHSYSEDNRDLAFQFAAGLATGDVDDDGDVDLYVVGGKYETERTLPKQRKRHFHQRSRKHGS